MKHIFLSTAMFVAVTTLTFAQSNDAKNGDGDQQAIRLLLTNVAIALSKNDAAVLDGLYTDDFTFINPAGVMLTKEQSLGGLRSGEMKFESFNMEDINVRRYGDTAIVTARVKVKGENGRRAFSAISRNTLTVVKTKGRWILAATQATPIITR